MKNRGVAPVRFVEYVLKGLRSETELSVREAKEITNLKEDRLGNVKAEGKSGKSGRCSPQS